MGILPMSVNIVVIYYAVSIRIYGLKGQGNRAQGNALGQKVPLR